MQDFTLAVGQWPVVSDWRFNMERAEHFLRHARDQGAHLALLPEMFQTPYDVAEIKERAEPADGPTLTRIRELATELALTIVAGSIPERVADRLYNSAYVIGPDGALLGVHRKIHLFDIDLPEVRMQESAVLTPGDRPLVLATPFARLGVAICYDVRFHDIFRFFQREEVEVVLLPAAFSQTTGSAHWHTLMRARAIDYQVYLGVACPAPTPGAKYQSFGHSLVVDPWGTIRAEAGEDVEQLMVPLDGARLADVRRRMPLRAHQRPDLYARW